MKIQFENKTYYFFGEKLEDGGPLAFPNQVDESGNLKLEHVFSESFAHLFSDGIIRKHGKEIGTIKNIKIINK